MKFSRKGGVFDKSISKLVDTAYLLKEKADYQDFIIISKDQAMEQIEKAEKVLGMDRTLFESMLEQIKMRKGIIVKTVVLFSHRD